MQRQAVYVIQGDVVATDDGHDAAEVVGVVQGDVMGRADINGSRAGNAHHAAIRNRAAGDDAGIAAHSDRPQIRRSACVEACIPANGDGPQGQGRACSKGGILTHRGGAQEKAGGNRREVQVAGQCAGQGQVIDVPQGYVVGADQGQGTAEVIVIVQHDIAAACRQAGGARHAQYTRVRHAGRRGQEVAAHGRSPQAQCPRGSQDKIVRHAA